MDLNYLARWRPSNRIPAVQTIDAHTGGEPFRIVVDGFPAVKGNTMLERREYARAHHEHWRKALMLEPRGHADMYGGILTPPANPESDIGVLFIHNDGYSTMCGHGIIALATVLVECGYVNPVKAENVMRIDTPAGTVVATVLTSVDQKIESVSFLNVPSYVVNLDDSIEVDGLGHVSFDLAFGGAYYAYVDAKSIGLSCDASNVNGLIAAGKAIKKEFRRQREIQHPFDKGMSFLYGVIFTERYEASDTFGKNVCIFADGEVDRSPTGTGVSGRLAIHFAKNEIEKRQEINIESIIGSVFTGSVFETTQFGGHEAIVPKIGGSAAITGIHEFLLDPEDEVGKGFMLR